MCGICGIVHRDTPVDERVLARMQETLAHRGPDHAGRWVDASAGIAMRRLSIIDCETGAQPMTNEDGSLWIVFNGEIYNFPELREELLRAGHVFRTRSDTETVLHLFEERRERAVEALHGMFAFAVYDRKARELFLARDRFGEKPLFYARTPDGVAFSSEVASLLTCPSVPRRLDREAVNRYFIQGYVEPPATVLQDVRELSPAHWMRVRDGAIDTRRYWSYRVEPEPMTQEEATGELRRRLASAVRRQMLSDVPLGAFLSGGLDSSSIVACMAQESPTRVKTFTVRFSNSSYDEGLVAAAVARHLGTEHEEIVVPPLGFSEEAVFRILDHVGVPFADSSAIPTYMLSSFARRYVKVCLSGDGGDEMLGGYDLFLWLQRLEQIDGVPAAGRRAARAIASAASGLPGVRGSSALRRIRKGLTYSLLAPAERLVALTALFTPQEVAALLRNAGGTPGWTAPGSNGRFGSLPPFHAMQEFRAAVGLPQDMLVKVDRMSMAASLETRAPFLDVEFADFARRVPDDLKIHGGVTKFVLREAVKPLLPREVFEHPKTGFSIPLHDWFNADFVAFARRHLSRAVIDRHGLFDPGIVERIVERGVSRTRDAADRSVYSATHQLWTLLMFQLWLDRFDVQAGA